MNQRDYDDPIDALKAELASVSPSPAFRSRVRQRIAGELDLLREELAAVAPSPEFAVRVRQGIDAAAETRKTSWFAGWRWVVPAGAVAAGVMAVIVLTRSGDDTPERFTVQVPVQAPIQAPVVVETSKPIATPKVTSNDERRTTNVGRRLPDARGPVAPAAPSDPMLEVITNQPAVLRAMWARVSQGSTAVSLAPPPTEEARDITVTPVEVSPVVVKWMVEPLPTPGVLPIIRRIAADMAERSTK